MSYLGDKKIIKQQVSEEYIVLAKSDKDSATCLAQAGFYRQACYFLLQAMEKNLRAKIFTLVDPNNKYFRDKNRSHSLDAAVNLLLEIISKGDSLIELQHKNNFKLYVLGTLDYQKLHNNLRYPWFSEKYQNFNLLEFKQEHFLELKSKLTKLENYIKDLY